jgi:predicted O-linked N-acetylglucosamine transferase (SPINDLY family)
MAGGLFNFFKPKAAKHSPSTAFAETLDRARSLRQQGQHTEALAICQEILARQPEHLDALFLSADIAAGSGESDRALQVFKKVLDLQPEHAAAHYKCGNLLKDRQQLEAALASYDVAIALDPGYAHAFCNRGVVLERLDRWDAALESYNRAILLTPGDALAHYNRAAVLRKLARPEEALASYGEAIVINPNYFEAYCNRGSLLTELMRWDEALSNFDRAIDLNPDYAEIHINRANLLVSMKRFLPAIASFDRGIALKADSRYALGARQYSKMSVCDWSDLPADVRRLASGIEAGETVSPPVPVLAVVDSVPLHYKAARIWVQEEHLSSPELPAIARRLRPGKARIGYFSCDFYEHPVPMLLAGVIETHDRSKYEVNAFSYGPDSQDEMRKRLQTSFDRFIDVRGKSDRDIALLAREMDIDIAVDLTGHTGSGRTGIFAQRAAPLQVNYLGYPGTMGADCMDYVIADATVVPEAHERYYAEKIVRLPNCFLPHDSTRAIASTVYSRDELGLPATGFVFCCFNNAYKINPDVFDGWMRILARVPDSVLWLSRNIETAMDNLRRECLRRGVDGERLIFARRMDSPAEHLARHRAADLFLDTRPYNAHATAVNALWAGLPVLTFPGEGFASRVVASLLKAVRLPELIATSAGNYEDMAVHMAENPQFHAGLKEKLAHNRLDSPLFDTRRFTRHLEAGYSMILERSRAGLPPGHIHVPP